MAPLHIAIDARRIRDFGIGTYIRNLVHALGAIDAAEPVHAGQRAGRCAHAGRPAGQLSAPPSTRAATSPARSRLSSRVPARLAPDLVHIPLNRVPLLMIRPYVVTVHDMATCFSNGRSIPKLRMQLRRFRFRRGLVRASRVIAVSEATRRDVRNLVGVPPSRMRLVYNAPDPGFWRTGRRPTAEERQRILERYQINYPFLLYAGNIRPPQKHPAPGGGVRGGARAARRPSGIQATCA